MTVSRIRANGAVATLVSTGLGRQGVPAVRRAVVAACIVLAASSAFRPVHGQRPAQPEEARLRKVVERLASPEFGGRSGAGGEKTVAYLVDQFRGLKLAPLFAGEYVQAIPGKEPGTVQGRERRRLVARIRR